MSLTGTLGKRDYGYAILLNKDEKFLLNQRVAKLICKDSILRKYAINILQSEAYLNLLFSLPSGTKQGNFSGEQILSIKIPLPSIKEQNQIVQYIEKETTRINCIISKSEKEIELLQEYRTALISEVVTGKIDVREEKI
ncbi:MAG: restriction endonuclease subunit S [Deltaproteobacteria bacterium]|nr:restriction endonuclease subunit S [Deltaproteobacteria bacterium]